MAAPKSLITDAELEILKTLWDAPGLTAREIAERLYEGSPSSSIGTVQKLITRLESKELVLRDRQISPHRFTATATREQVAGMQLDEFAEKLSEGSLSPFVLHLVQAKRLSPQEKAQIRRMLEEE